MAKSVVTIDGVKYSSRTDAAKAMVAAGKSLSEAAKATGMTYQTVYANTKGADKASARRVTYRVLAMGKSGKKSTSEIAKKTGLSVPKVVALLKANSIAIVTKEASKPVKVKKAKASKEVAVDTLVPVVVEVPDSVVLVDEIPVDDSAKAAAIADMQATA